MSEFWDRRYAEPVYACGTDANAFLAAQRSWLRPAWCALAAGDGEGRNGVWLAEQGLEVWSVDASAVGLAKAQALADRRGVAIRTEQADLTRRMAARGVRRGGGDLFVHFPSEHRARACTAPCSKRSCRAAG